MNTNEQIKEYTLNSAKSILDNTNSEFNEGKTTSISDWEYYSLTELTNYIPVDNFTNTHLIPKKIKTKLTNINWRYTSKGYLVPYFKYNGFEYSLKSYKYLTEQNIGLNSEIEITENDFKVLHKNPGFTITCPECFSKTTVINDKPYCKNNSCLFWYKHFYKTFINCLEDKFLKKYIKENVNYNDFNVLSKFIDINFLNKYFVNTINLEKLYLITLNSNLIQEDTFINYINKLRTNIIDVNYFDYVSKHLVSYLYNLGITFNKNDN